MNLKKISFRFFGVIVLLLLLGIGYILLTINRKPIIEVQETNKYQNTYVIPDAIATIKNDKTESIQEIEQKLKINLKDANNVSTQITMAADNITHQNKVIAFNSKSAKDDIEKQFESQTDLVKKVRDDVVYYQSQKLSEIYFFPDGKTLVITEDIQKVKPKKENEKKTQNLSNNNGIAFTLNKNDPSLEHFTNNLPEFLVDRFEGISGSLSEEDQASYFEIKMESAFYARALEMALPKVLNQLKSKIIKVDGKFVVSGENVTLDKSEMEMIRDINEKVNIKSGGKSVYVILNKKEEATYLLKTLENLLLAN